jgi:hypothetical protein
VLPDVPGHDDQAGQCAWLSAVLRLDPAHPVTGAVHEGLRGAEGHVVLRRAGAPDIRFEPASTLSTSRRLRPALTWQLQPTDGEPYGLKDDHCNRVAHVARLLCGACAAPNEAAETAAIVGTFLSDAIVIEGCTTYGDGAARYEALQGLRCRIDEQTGRTLGQLHALIDSATGEYVIRVGDLQAAARRHLGNSVPHGWLDARMENLGWARVSLQGWEQSGRMGRRGPHLRAGVYRGHLVPDDESEGAVNT